MGLFKSICPECGEEHANREMYLCLQCGVRACKSHLVPHPYVKKGIFKDKHIERYHCARCDRPFDDPPN